MTQTTGFQGCPILGVGLGLRRPLLDETLAATDILDFVEIIPENYMARGGSSIAQLEQAQAVYPIVSHGVCLSVGSTDPWDEAYLVHLKKLFQKINPPWFSDHLCYSGASGTYSNDLIPVPRTREAVDHLVKRIRFIQETFERPFLIENISFYLDYPENELSEQDFLSEIVERADCGLLLDVNNVYVNYRNHGWDPIDFFTNIPLERVVQMHVAGHGEYPEGIIDTHSEAVCPGVWDLLDWTLKRCQPAGILLERDGNYPEFEELRDELVQIRQVWQAAQAAGSPTQEEEVACN